MRRFLPLVAALALLSSACGGSSTATVDDAAPDENPSGGDAWSHDFVATGLDGSTIDAGDYEGQDLVLWFWAPW